MSAFSMSDTLQNARLRVIQCNEEKVNTAQEKWPEWTSVTVVLVMQIKINQKSDQKCACLPLSILKG